MHDIKFDWTHFIPTIGGSVGREDMGEFCQINSNLFIVPYLSALTAGVSQSDIETKIIDTLPHLKSGGILEWQNGEFTHEITFDWIHKIETSIQTRSNWR